MPEEEAVEFSAPEAISSDNTRHNNGPVPRLWLMACDADHVALYVGSGGKWNQIAGPFLKTDRDNQAAAIVGHLSKKMNAEQEAKLQRAYQKRGRYHDPFLFVGLSEMLLHGIEHPLLK